MNQRALSSISAAVVLHNENDDTAQYDGSFFLSNVHFYSNHEFLEKSEKVEYVSFTG